MTRFWNSQGRNRRRRGHEAPDVVCSLLCTLLPWMRPPLLLESTLAGEYARTLLKRSSSRLFAFDGLKEGLEIPLAEAARPPALNDLEEESRSILDRLGEDLEQVTLVVAVDQNPQLSELAQVFLHFPHAIRQHFIVGGRDSQKRHVILHHGAHALDDIAGCHGDVLYAGSAVILQEFVDLRPAPALGRLVDRKLDPPPPIGDDLRHQRRVFGADVLVVKAGEDRKTHDLAVVVDPIAHLAFFDVGDDMIDRLEPDRMERIRTVSIRVDGPKTGRENA